MHACFGHQVKVIFTKRATTVLWGQISVLHGFLLLYKKGFFIYCSNYQKILVSFIWQFMIYGYISKPFLTSKINCWLIKK